MDTRFALELTGTSPPAERSQWWLRREGREPWLCDPEQSDWAPDHNAPLPLDEENAQAEGSNHHGDGAWALVRPLVWASRSRLAHAVEQSQAVEWLHKVEVRILEAGDVPVEVLSLLEHRLQKLEVVHFSPREEGHWGPLGREEGDHWTCWFPGQGLEKRALLTLPVSLLSLTLMKISGRRTFPGFSDHTLTFVAPLSQ